MTNIEWFRVVAYGDKPTYQGQQLIVCRQCMVTHKLTILNRVFGASQTCAKCGVTDKKG